MIGSCFELIVVVSKLFLSNNDIHYDITQDTLEYVICLNKDKQLFEEDNITILYLLSCARNAARWCLYL